MDFAPHAAGRSLSRLLGAMLCVAFAALALAAASASAEETTVLGWGTNPEGGIGTGSASRDGCMCIATPQQVVGVSGVTQVAAGQEHTIALLRNGTVLGWGSNFRGQLGDGSTERRLNPIQVPGLQNVVAIAAGEQSSLALLADGTVKAWGANSNGALGLGSVSGPELCSTNPMVPGVACSKAPITVPGLSNVVAIAVGGAFAVALRADGTVVAWGYDGTGGVGDATGGEQCTCIPRPTVVPGISGAVAIAAGETEASALLADGTVMNWGANQAGGLGTGGTEVASANCNCLGPVPVKGLSGARSVAAGGGFGLAALSAGGAASWGFNLHGELGNGAATPVTTDPCQCVPTQSGVTQLPGPSAIAAGERHALALLPDRSVVAWGENDLGQLGIGAPTDATPHPTPVPVDVHGASAIVAGAEDSFALIGPTHSLAIVFAGADAASGTVGGAGLLCPPTCSAAYPDGQAVGLRGEGRNGKRFAGFSGDCSGAEACLARLDQDATVVATLGVPTGTKIARARIDSRHGAASFQAAAAGAITGYQCMLVRPRGHGKAKRPKPRFANCAAKKSFKRLAPGRYTFEVRALDRLGPDAHPGVRRFRIAAKRSRGHRAG